MYHAIKSLAREIRREIFWGNFWNRNVTWSCAHSGCVNHALYTNFGALKALSLNGKLWSRNRAVLEEGLLYHNGAYIRHIFTHEPRIRNYTWFDILQIKNLNFRLMPKKSRRSATSTTGMPPGSWTCTTSWTFSMPSAWTSRRRYVSI